MEENPDVDPYICRQLNLFQDTFPMFSLDRSAGIGFCLRKRSGAGKKSKAITMANNKPHKPNLEALKARMDSLQELIAFESNALRRFDLIQELLLILPLRLY